MLHLLTKAIFTRIWYLASVNYFVDGHFVVICLTLEGRRFRKKLFVQLSFSRCYFWSREKVLVSEKNSMFS